MKINELNEAGVGKIVKGVNTTPDVQPGETERQAKKLFPMNKNGKPKSLGVPGATPNQAFNLGLTENMSVTGTETRRAEKKKGIKVGTPEWFKHWFDLPYLREDISKQELLAKLKDQQRSRYTRAMLDAMHRLVKSKGAKHSLGSYAFEIAKVFGFSGRELEKMYRDEYMSEDVTQSELNALERVIDGVFGRIGIDVEFTRHFLDRANDDRNGKPITIQELGKLFAKEYKRWGKPIAQMGPDAQAVMKDLESDINIPFVLNWNGEELELKAKTVMRKKNFKTSNKEFPVESVENITKRIFEIAGRTVRVNKDTLEKIIRAQAKELGISFAVARAIAYQESGIKQDITGDLKLKNKAHGLYQIRLPALQDVNRLYGTNYTIDDIKNDPRINARVGMLYFKAQKEFYGAQNDEQALAGYNGGPKAIQGGNKGANNYAKSVLTTASGTEEKPPRVYQNPKNPNPQITPPPVPKSKPDYRTQPYPPQPKEPTVTIPATDPDGSSGTIIPDPEPGISQNTKNTINQVVKDIVQPEPVTYQDLATASGIADPNKIQAGGTINLPNGTTYVIKSGDTLSGIAKNYNKGTLGENVPTTNKPGSIGQHINWAGKNAPDKPKSNVSVARRKQPEPQAWWQTMLQKGRNLFDDEQLDLKKKIEITAELKKLNDIFNKNKREIRIVGGAVRDLALDKSPKDIDLATDATPQEMQTMFDNAGIRHIPTGIEHGTITAVINGEEFEITTLRADVETDGRRAEVEFVRSWEEDAKRRDLTYNAMSMDFQGNLYDYHGGMDDLQNKVTRFVGDPAERIKEDYLRTLRYFRFQGRLDKPTFDKETMQAIANNTDGLKQLSVERVWMEMGKILSGSNIQQILNAMQETGVLGAIGLNAKPSQNLMDGGDPIINLARITDDESIGLRWKMSNEEKGKLGFLISQKGQTHDKKWYTDMMADGFDRTQLDALARYNNQDDMIAYVKSFKAPEFPVDGNDLMQLGHERGPKIGQTLNALRAQWKAGNFSASKDELLKTMNEKLQEDTSIPKYLYKWVDMPQFQKYIDAKKLPLKRGYAHYIESIDDFVKGNSFTDEQHISSWEGNTLIRIDSSTINNKIYPIAGNRTYLQTMHMKNPSVYDDAYLYEPEEIDEYWIAGPVDLSSVEIVKGISEKITKRTPMGDVIDDFYKSDAPQFKGKSKAKRRQMAIAAKLSKMDENFIAEGIMLRLERDYDADMLVLHVKDTKTDNRTEVRGKLGYESGGYDEKDKLHQLLDKIGKAANISDLMNGEIVHINPKHPKGPESIKTATKLANENFADGKKPGRKGLSKRVGIPKGATLAQLEKIAKNSSGEKRRMAQWQLNMRRGENKNK